MSDSRKEFEARSDYSKRLLWKRGGSAFAEDISESDYVDQGVQRDWLLWSEAWQAARRDALEEAITHLMKLHADANGQHNYYHFAANGLRALAAQTGQEGK